MSRRDNESDDVCDVTTGSIKRDREEEMFQRRW